MRRCTYRSWAAACALVLHGLVDAAPLLVVVPESSAIHMLSHEELADIYLDRNAARGTHGVLPLDRTEDPLRERYYRGLGISPTVYRAHWAKRIFTGRGRPPPTVSSGELAGTLERQRNVIFYVEAAERPAKTRVVATVE